jgi:hypothetical protein
MRISGKRISEWSSGISGRIQAASTQEARLAETLAEHCEAMAELRAAQENVAGVLTIF